MKSYHTQIHMKSWPKLKLCQVRVSAKLFKIIRLASKKSYLVIIGPNSHEKFTLFEL